MCGKRLTFISLVELHLLTNVTLLLRLPGALTDAPKRKFMIFQCRHRREKEISSLFKTRYEMSGSLNAGSAEGESFV